MSLFKVTSFNEVGYDGNKITYPDWIEHLKSEMRGNADASKFLPYFFDSHPEDPLNSGKFIYPKEYTLIVVALPLSLVPLVGEVPWTDIQHTRRQKLRTSSLEWNVPINKGKAALFKILAKSLDPKVLKSIATFTEEPHEAFHSLAQRYGPSSYGNNEKRLTWLRGMMLTMNPDDMFANFWAEFQRFIDDVEATDAFVLAMLFMSKGNNKHQIQFLPERLQTSLVYCNQHELSLKKSISHIQRMDDEFWSAKSDQLSSKKIMQVQVASSSSSKIPGAFANKPFRGKGLLCFNCGQQSEKGSDAAHISSGCPLPCGYCKSTSHKSDTCKKRKLDRDNSTRTDKKIGNQNAIGASKKGKRTESGSNTVAKKIKVKQEDGSEESDNDAAPAVRKLQKVNSITATINKLAARAAKLEEQREDIILHGENDDDDDEEGSSGNEDYSGSLFQHVQPGRLVQYLRSKRETPVTRTCKMIRRVSQDVQHQNAGLTRSVLQISSSTRRAKLDSGSMETVTPNIDLFDPLSFEMFSDSNQPGIILETASGDPLRIVGQGKINEILDDVILSTCVTETLIGVGKIKETKQIGIDILPGKAVNGVGSILYREVSRDNDSILCEAMGLANGDFEIDIDKDLSPTGIFFRKVDMHSIAAQVLTHREKHATMPPCVRRKRVCNHLGASQVPTEKIIPQWSFANALKIAREMRHQPSPLSQEHKSIFRIYGTELNSVPDKVNFIQRALMCMRKDALWMAMGDRILNFPVTSHQIKKYWSPLNECYAIGNLKNRKARNNILTNQEEDQSLARAESRGDLLPSTGQAYIREVDVSKTLKSTPTDEVPDDEDKGPPKRPLEDRIAIPARMVDQRKSSIGSLVGMDILAYLGATVLISRDFLSGKSLTVRIPSKAAVDVGFRYILSVYAAHGHVIKNVRTDAEAIFRTDKLKQLALENNILLEHSPPGLKEFNGLAEANVQAVKRVATGMMACAPHLPGVFWVGAIQLAEMMLALRQTKDASRADMTVFEHFFGYKADLKKLITLPFGQPVYYHASKASRSKEATALPAHAYLGVYMGPAWPEYNIPGGIVVWSFKTKRTIVTVAYWVLLEIPRSFQRYTNDVFKEPDATLEEATAFDEATMAIVTRARREEFAKIKKARNDEFLSVHSHLVDTSGPSLDGIQPDLIIDTTHIDLTVNSSSFFDAVSEASNAVVTARKQHELLLTQSAIATSRALQSEQSVVVSTSPPMVLSQEGATEAPKISLQGDDDDSNQHDVSAQEGGDTPSPEPASIIPVQSSVSKILCKSNLLSSPFGPPRHLTAFTVRRTVNMIKRSAADNSTDVDDSALLTRWACTVHVWRYQDNVVRAFRMFPQFVNSDEFIRARDMIRSRPIPTCDIPGMTNDDLTAYYEDDLPVSGDVLRATLMDEANYVRLNGDLDRHIVMTMEHIPSQDTIVGALGDLVLQRVCDDEPVLPASTLFNDVRVRVEKREREQSCSPTIIVPISTDQWNRGSDNARREQTRARRTLDKALRATTVSTSVIPAPVAVATTVMRINGGRNLRSRLVPETDSPLVKKHCQSASDLANDGTMDDSSDDTWVRIEENDLIARIPVSLERVPANADWSEEYGQFDMSACHSAIPFASINFDTVGNLRVLQADDRRATRVAIGPSKIVEDEDGLYCVRATREGHVLCSCVGPRFATEEEALNTGSTALWDNGVDTTPASQRITALQGYAAAANDPVGRHDLINAEFRSNASGDAELYALVDIESGDEILVAYGADYWSRCHHTHVPPEDMLLSYPEIIWIFEDFPERCQYRDTGSTFDRYAESVDRARMIEELLNAHPSAPPWYVRGRDRFWVEGANQMAPLAMQDAQPAPAHYATADNTPTIINPPQVLLVETISPTPPEGDPSVSLSQEGEHGADRQA